MTTADTLSDLELAALISSKICHDAIGPVGAIRNGLEVLDGDNDPGNREFALSVIRDSTEQASAKLQFARFAFGAAGSEGAVIDLRNAEEISRGFVETGKHQLIWNAVPAQMNKDKVKLLLNMVASCVTALPRGGTMTVTISGETADPRFHVRCTGNAARVPQHLPDFLTGDAPGELNAMTIQAYYTCRLAGAAGMKLNIAPDGADIVVTAVP